MRKFLFLLPAFALLGACGDSPVAPSQPPPTQVPTPAPAETHRQTGQGVMTFQLPDGVTRVRITASAAEGSCRQFLVYVAQRMIVSEVLGTCAIASGRTYDQTRDVLGGRVDIRGSTDADPGQQVSWTIDWGPAAQ